MPTHEERLSTVEQSVVVLRKASVIFSIMKRYCSVSWQSRAKISEK